jgi:gentisate 1,2-dioxygenase
MNHWDEIIALRDKQRADLKDPIIIVKGNKRPQENSAMGLLRWYMHPGMQNNALQTMNFYEQELPPGGRSGRLQFQGGQVMFILEGQGYTLVDGVKHPWAANDVLNLPLRRDGIVVQHFNADSDKPAKFVVVEPNLMQTATVDRGAGFNLLEASPDYVKGATS